MAIALGFAFSTVSQDLALFVPLSLPSEPSTGNSEIVSTNTGLRIEKAGTYQISYTVTLLLPDTPGGKNSIRLFLTLNGPNNLVPGSGIAANSNVIGAKEVDVSSGVVLINLSPGDLIQITPVEIIGHPTASAASLTIAQIG